MKDNEQNLETSDNSDITISIPGAPSGLLGGVLTEPIVNGVATFDQLIVNAAGSYTIAASSTTPGFFSFSGSLSISAAAPAQLSFMQQPGATATNTPFQPPVSVVVEDIFGNVVTDDTSIVSLSIASGGSPGASLGGSISVAADDGVATFSTLTVDHVGTGYILAQAAQPVTPGRSRTALM